MLREEPTARPGTWIGLTRGGQWAWLERSVRRWRIREAELPSGGVLTLDGAAVTRVPAFYCAIGELVNGPGGYFGWNLDALVDCLRGGFGVSVPFTLRWRDAAVARAALGHEETARSLRWRLKHARATLDGATRRWIREGAELAERGEGATFFDDVVDIFESGGVALELL